MASLPGALLGRSRFRGARAPTQSGLALEWFEKPVLAVVACEEIETVVCIQDNRDLHPNKVPPFYLYMQEDDL